MSMRSPIHSQDRILGALQLQPMTPQQLEACLQLHRTTVAASLDALACRRKVECTAIGSRECGTWPEVWSLASHGERH